MITEFNNQDELNKWLLENMYKLGHNEVVIKSLIAILKKHEELEFPFGIATHPGEDFVVDENDIGDLQNLEIKTKNGQLATVWLFDPLDTTMPYLMGCRGLGTTIDDYFMSTDYYKIWEPSRGKVMYLVTRGYESFQNEFIPRGVAENVLAKHVEVF